MQLVAYSAQEVYVYGPNQWNKKRHKKKIRFFYDKIKNIKKPVKERKLDHIQNKSIKPNDPGYVYNLSRPKYKPIPMASTATSIASNPILKQVYKPKTSPIKRARANFGWKKVCHLDQFISTKKIPFNKTFWEIANKPKLANKIVLIEGLGKIVRTIKKHVRMVRKLDITNHIIINQIKNTECPITLKEIKNQYIECDNCKICYDYADTTNWFESNRYCSYCTLPICKDPKDIQYNQIYKFLCSNTNLAF